MAGRPTKYNRKILKKINKMIDEYLTLGIVRRKNIAGKGENPVYITEVDFPSIEKLSFRLGINIDTIYSWSKKTSFYYKPEFSEAVKRWRSLSRNVLKDASLAGVVNPKISALLLGNLGVRDDNQRSKVAPGGNTFIIGNILEKAHSRLKDRENNEIIDVSVENTPNSKIADITTKVLEADNSRANSPVDELKNKLANIHGGKQ